MSPATRSPIKSAFSFGLALALAGWSSARGQVGVTQAIVVSGTPATGLSGNFVSFGTPVLNNSGAVAFAANATADKAIYRASSTGLVIIASSVSAQAPPVIGGSFTSFSTPLLNESGVVSFSAVNGVILSGVTVSAVYKGSGGDLTAVAATGQAAPGLTGMNVNAFSPAFALSDNGRVVFGADAAAGASSGSGIYFQGSGTGISAIATTAQTAPGLGGVFTDFGVPVQSNVGMVAFQAVTASGAAIFSSLGSGLVPIVTTLQSAPGIGGTFTSVGIFPSINDKGTVAFLGQIDLGSQIVGSGIFTGSGGTLTPIATTAQIAPGFTTNFTTFTDPALSNSGRVTFRGESASGVGIYAGAGGNSNLLTVAKTGDVAPGLGGNFAAFGSSPSVKPAINDIGTVAFYATNVSGGKGIFLGDGQQVIAAAYVGQSVPGGTITNLIALAGGADPGSGSQLNNNGQIVYRATVAGKATVMLFTPTLHFRAPASGMWAANSNWTVGLLPASVHDVVIDPTASLTVTGPLTRTTVKSLTVNGTGGGIAELALQSGGAITAPGGVTTGPAGRVSGNGKLTGNFSNAGIISPGLGSSTGSLSVMGNVTLLPTSHLALDIGGLVRRTGYDFLNVSGAFTLAGTLDLSLLGGFAPQLGNSFDLFDATSTIGAFSQINLPALTGGLTWNTSLLPVSGIVSVASTGPPVASWNLNGGGSWAAQSSWVGGIPNGSGARVTFGSGSGVVNSPTTVTLNGPKTVGTIIFDNTSSYLVTGGGTDSLTLDNGAATPSITVLNGSHVLDAALVITHDTDIDTAANTALTLSRGITGADDLTKIGAGILNLDGAQNYQTLNANAGTTNVNGSFTGGTATVNASATVNFNASQTLGSLNIGAGAPLAESGAVVPEPGSLGLLVLGAFGALTRRRRDAHGRAAW